jgi:MHS family alpha-ketoglutarate permease-like MFS transporter
MTGTLKNTDGVRPLTMRERLRSLVAVVCGNYLEWFDWTMYVVFTPYIAATFFDPTDRTSAVLATLAVFAVAFAARPLGGYLLGRLADRKGRKTALVVAMLMMAFGSLAIAILPGYETLGALASVILFLVRVSQGIAHGGESASAYTYLAEIAPKNRRGLWGSTIMMTVTLGVISATGLGAIMTSLLTAEQMGSWGWRVPFILGALLAVLALWIRRSARESSVFEEEATEVKAPRVITRRQVTIISVRLIALGVLTQVLYYTWVSFYAAYAINAKGMEAKGAYLASLGAQLIALVVLPFMGYLSDRIGRRRSYVIWSLAVIAVVFPTSAMLTDAPVSLFMAQTICLIVWAIQSSIHSTVMAEQAPTEIRATSVGVFSSVAAALTGGTAPYLNTWLTGMGYQWMFSVYIIVLAVITLIAVRYMPETAGLGMDEVPLPGEPYLKKPPAHQR